MSLRSADLVDASNAQAVNNFREYLQIRSVHPEINYDGCVKFLEKQAKSLDLPIKIVTVVPGKPIVIMTWTGKNPNLPSIMLNSHMDVVPVYEDMWSQKPFGGEIVDGKVYGRGAQDMKCVGIWYLEAIRMLKSNKVTLECTLHVTFVPDEEIGGKDGMKVFVETEEFKKLNIGCALDEGMPSTNEEFALFYDERCMWHMNWTCPGISTHGSALVNDTAGEKVAYILGKIYEFRRNEQNKLKYLKGTMGDVTAINLNVIHGGVQTNVTPAEIKFGLDCRVTPKEDFKTFEKMIESWRSEAGSGVTIDFVEKWLPVPATKLNDENPYWMAFKKATEALNLKLVPQICPGRTDGVFLRAKGIPVLGFSAINNTELLLHQHDEHLGVETFLKGIQIYCKIIEAMANV
ncbi:unnamed protein product [Brassicogethes aeneus]|uniref:N-acyl-aliphatic-L-amino acid amidohydrolase n=1 Tax=Brassicogethes aeneus TaxID=1431903 RepID=A0A9P0B6E4_BRAAE|nr:unnamed protein product [Brassicogethes aeneus]